MLKEGERKTEIEVRVCDFEWYEESGKSAKMRYIKLSGSVGLGSPSNSKERRRMRR